MLHSTQVLATLLLLSAIYGHVRGLQEGTYASLNKIAIANDGYVNSYDLIRNGLSLSCHTNKMSCCKEEKLGDWFYPNGTTVQSYTTNTNRSIPDFFFRSRSRGTVNMATRYSRGPPERGRFYCEVPDENDVNQTVYVNILDIGAVRVISSVSMDNVGQIFGLVCSVDIVNDIEDLGVPPPTFEWFFGPPSANSGMLPSGVAVSTVARNGTTYTSTLFFTPPKVFHAGTYTCRLGGNPRMEANATITVDTIGGILSRAATPPETTPELELLHCVIALCSIILLVALASAIVIIGLLCSLMRNGKCSEGSPPESDNSLYEEVNGKKDVTTEKASHEDYIIISR